MTIGHDQRPGGGGRSIGARGLLRLLVVFHESELLGATTSVLRAVPGLQRYGWSVSGWFPASGPASEAGTGVLSTVAVGRSPLAYSLRGWRRPPGVLDRLRMLPPYLRSFRAAVLRIRPHVVHANTLLALPEATVARRLGLPLVLQVHEHFEPTVKRRAALLAASRAADVLVAVSTPVSRMLSEASGNRPVFTVHNGVPTSPTGSGGLSGFTVGTIATVSRTKGTDDFLRAAALAAARRPGIVVEHAGQSDLHGDPAFESEIQELTRAAALRPALRLLGRQDAFAVLSRWDAFLLMSRSEGFPLVVLEAMATGVPVVATAVGGIAEQIEHLSSGILVAPGDVESAADWIVRLHDDVELRRTLGRGGAERARRLFTLDRQAEGLHAAYLHALNARFGPP